MTTLITAAKETKLGLGLAKLRVLGYFLHFPVFRRLCFQDTHVITNNKLSPTMNNDSKHPVALYN